MGTSFNWVGGSMSDASSWSPPSGPAVEPGPTDTIHIGIDGTLTGSVGVNATYANADLKLQGSIATNDFEITGGSFELDAGGALSVGSLNEYVGDVSGVTASMTQKGGTNAINGVLEVCWGGGIGSYELDGGTITVNAEYIGQNAVGTFTQTGGSNTVSDRIVLGINVTSGALGTGTYTLGGTGKLSFQEMFIGSDPNCPGTFNFNTAAGDAATVKIGGAGGYPGLIVGGQGIGILNHGSGNITSTISVGFRTGGHGTYNFNGGEIKSTAEKIGDSGTGIFNQTAGLNEETSNDLIVGNASGSDGTYNLHNGSVVVETGNLDIGAQANSTGDFEFDTGAGDAGTLDVKTGEIVVGDGGTGTFTLGAGSVTANLEIGAQTGSDGTFTLKAGTFTSTNGGETVGDVGTGEFDQAAGTNKVDGDDNLYVGNGGGDGTYNLSGTGALTIGTGDFDIAVGGGSSGTFNFNTAQGDKATLTVASKVINVGVHGSGSFVMGSGSINAKFVVGGQVGGQGSVELDGGSIKSVGQIVGNDGTGIFTMNAGTDKISGGGDLMLGAFAAGGGTFDLVKGTLQDGGELVGYAGAGTLTQTGGTNKISGTGSLLDLGTQANAQGTYTLSKGSLSAILETIGDAGTGTFTQKGTSTNKISGTTAKLDLGAQSTGNGTYVLDAGTLQTIQEIVGDTGTGAFTLKGTSVDKISGTGAKLDIGAQSTGHGTFTLSGGKLATKVELVGDAGTGTFIENGGSNAASGTGSKLDIGVQGSSNGSYVLTSGMLKATLETVGDAGTGAFQQKNGTNTITGTGSKLDIGAQGAGHGSYELDMGTLKALVQIVGDNATGTFTLKGGVDQVTGTGAKLDLGAQSAGKGTYNLTGGALTALVEIVGDAGKGTFSQSGTGTNTISGTGSKLDIGAQGTGNGAYNLSGGALKALVEIVGDAGKGTFTQSGAGANSTSGTGSKLDIGAQSTGNGTYTLSGGTLKALVETVGDVGKGAFVQSGTSTNTISGTGSKLDIGAQGTGDGIYTLNAGSLKATAETIGDGATGTFTQDGGTNTLSGAFDVGAQAAGQGTYNLELGALKTVGETVGDAGTGHFNQSGGTNAITGNLTIGNAGTGVYNLTGGSLTLKAASGSTASITLGATSGANGTLSVSNGTVSTPELIVGSGGTGNVTTGTGGVIDVAQKIEVATGSSIVSTAGAIVIGTGLTVLAGMIGVGKSGTLIGAGMVTGAIDDAKHGTVEAHGGVLTLDGAVTGGGTLLIDDGATLDLGGSNVDAVMFEGASGILTLDDATAMTGEITGLVAGDTIDLTDIKVGRATRSGHTLTVTEKGGAILTFQINGTFTNTKFEIQSDGHGGDDIIMVAKTPGAHLPAVSAQQTMDGFVFSSAAPPSGAPFLLVKGFDAQHDAFDLPVAVKAVDATISHGALSLATFSGDLATAIGVQELGAHHAVIFRPSSGSLAGDTFLIVDGNGIAGYQAGQDFVFELNHAHDLGALTIGDFV